MVVLLLNFVVVSGGDVLTSMGGDDRQPSDTTNSRRGSAGGMNTDIGSSGASSGSSMYDARMIESNATQREIHCSFPPKLVQTLHSCSVFLTEHDNYTKKNSHRNVNFLPN